MKEQTTENKEAAPVAVAPVQTPANPTVPVQTPANLTAPEEPKKADDDSDDYSYSDEEEEHDGIVPTTEFDMKKLAKTENLQETMCGKKSFRG